MSKRSRHVAPEDCKNWIGKPVAKLSGKPFKSTRKVNVVKGITDNPNMPGNVSFTFFEDDSIVEARQCCLFVGEA
jgi:hypothetical protein